MSEKYVALTYIGKREEHQDNIVRGRGRVWNPGRSRRVSLSEYELYLAHADEFVLTTPLLLTSPASADLSSDEQVSALLLLVGNLELQAAKEVLAAAEARIDELGQRAERMTVDPENRQRFNERREKIAGAVSLMNDTNPHHFTDTGRPRVEVVREKSGLEDVSAAEIADAVASA